MAKEIGKEQCESCGKYVPYYDIINFCSEGTCREVCTCCYNNEMSLYAGIKFEHVEFDPVKILDSDNVLHEFHFKVRLLGVKVAIDAFELKDDYFSGYMFTVVGNAKDDILKTYEKLYKRIRKALSRKHIELKEGKMRICDEGIVRGRISYDEDTDGQIPSIVIDGKEISWGKLGRMVMTYEGFQFKLEIIDPSDET